MFRRALNLKFVQGVRTNLIIFFLSQALTLIATRLYLFLTDYPQIAFGEYHLAHVLWGGLLMYVAFLLTILEYERKKVIFTIAGIGYALFIDEVGKFITVENDYFHFLAIPIILVNLGLTLILTLTIIILDWRRVKKP